MSYEEDEKKPGRKEFKEDMADAVKKGTRHLKKKAKAVKKVVKKLKGKKKYDHLSTAELRELVTQKRNAVLAKAKLPMKVPRGRAKLIEICKKIKK